MDMRFIQVSYAAEGGAAHAAAEAFFGHVRKVQPESCVYASTFARTGVQKRARMCRPIRIHIPIHVFVHTLLRMLSTECEEWVGHSLLQSLWCRWMAVQDTCL